MTHQFELFSDTPFALRVPIEEAIRTFRENYWSHLPSDKKSEAIFRRLEMFFKGHYLDSISSTDVERLRRWMHEMGYKDSTINRTHMVLSRIYTWFESVKDGRTIANTDFSKIVLPAKNPAALVKKADERPLSRAHKQEAYVTKAQVKFLCAMSDHDLSEILDTLFWTRLRPGDLFSLTSNNVDLKRRLIFGVQHKTISTNNKHGVPFRIYIPKEKVEMIERRLSVVKPGETIFKKYNLQKRWKHTRQLCGMPLVQMRDIRGAAASFLLDHAVDAETVRKALGHTSLKMLQRYDHRPSETMISTSKILSDNTPDKPIEFSEDQDPESE